MKTAKALVEDTKTLVAGAASSQEQLAVAAQNAVTTIVQLSEVVKSGAGSLGSPNKEAQVMLINAVKDVASALSDLMQSTKQASGKSIQDPAMHHLKDSAKVGVQTFSSSRGVNFSNPSSNRMDILYHSHNHMHDLPQIFNRRISRVVCHQCLQGIFKVHLQFLP